MAVTVLLAQCVVRDSAAAEQWYSRVLGRRPEARPMAGLLEWHWPPGATGGDTRFGLQVWTDPDRAGRSAVVLFDDDLDEVVRRFDDAGVEHTGPAPGGGGRVVEVQDPDGNRLVVVG